MVNVEERSLCPFKEDLLAGVYLAVHEDIGVGDVPGKPFGIPHVPGADVVGTERLCLKEVLQEEIKHLKILRQLFPESLPLEEVEGPDPVACDLIGICRPYPPAGGAYLLPSLLALVLL